jgi:hypothetical protein
VCTGRGRVCLRPSEGCAGLYNATYMCARVCLRPFVVRVCVCMPYRMLYAAPSLGCAISVGNADARLVTHVVHLTQVWIMSVPDNSAIHACVKKVLITYTDPGQSKTPYYNPNNPNNPNKVTLIKSAPNKQPNKSLKQTKIIWP